ncbi:MAG: pyruvate kinase [Planctomycetes bacterium]|nr:pyruvate kinase [Planctomycetota bacterium]
MPINLDEIESLLRALEVCRRGLLEEEARWSGKLRELPARKQPSARNLAHYLALRRHDLRPLQRRLAALGLSSLGRSEACALASLDAVIDALHRIAGHSYDPPGDADACVGFEEGRLLLDLHTCDLLGPAPLQRNVRIMVTMPSEAASDYPLMCSMLEGGMDCMRINCAHDDPAAWQGMLDNLKQARRELGRSCVVHMDLGGPKLRTGKLRPAGRFLSWHPSRNHAGALVRPARVRLVPPDAGPPAGAQDLCLPVPAEFIGRLEAGDRIDFTDQRGARRCLRVSAREGPAALAEADRTAYVAAGAELCVREKALSAQVGELPEVFEPLLLHRGDELVLTAEQAPGAPAEIGPGGAVLRPARIPCTLPEVFASLKAGERIWFDDGKIGGRIESAGAAEVRVRITHARPRGERLLGDKGINLPDSAFSLKALTDEDLRHLPFVAAHADTVGLSFVAAPEDIAELQARLERLNATRTGIVLKIETRRAFERLPDLLVAAMRSPSAGVMIARGDLAVEVGYERLAEVQEEVLWLCEAAHVPSVWATQVLETMAKKGLPSRAEITDAAMSERAECVMLNKGPHVVAAIRALDSILRRMEDHQAKKSSLLRPLHF